MYIYLLLRDARVRVDAADGNQRHFFVVPVLVLDRNQTLCHGGVKAYRTVTYTYDKVHA